jgi:hypothetical protein
VEAKRAEWGMMKDVKKVKEKEKDSADRGAKQLLQKQQSIITKASVL